MGLFLFGINMLGGISNHKFIFIVLVLIVHKIYCCYLLEFVFNTGAYIHVISIQMSLIINRHVDQERPLFGVEIKITGTINVIILSC